MIMMFLSCFFMIMMMIKPQWWSWCFCDDDHEGHQGFCDDVCYDDQSPMMIMRLFYDVLMLIMMIITIIILMLLIKSPTPVMIMLVFVMIDDLRFNGFVFMGMVIMINFPLDQKPLQYDHDDEDRPTSIWRQVWFWYDKFINRWSRTTLVDIIISFEMMIFMNIIHGDHRMIVMMIIVINFPMDDQSPLWWCRNESKTFCRKFSLKNFLYWKRYKLRKAFLEDFLEIFIIERHESWNI